MKIRLSTLSNADTLDKERCDIAIVYGRAPAQGRAEPLLTETLRPLCSPGLAQALRSPADLARKATLIHSVNALTWSDYLRRIGHPDIRPHNEIWLDRSTIAIDAAVAGLGVVLESELLAEQELRDGRLVAPFTGPGTGVRTDSYILVRSPGSRRGTQVATVRGVAARADRRRHDVKGLPMDQNLTNIDIDAALGEAKGALRRRPPGQPSASIRHALRSLPGGNTRTGIFFDPFPGGVGARRGRHVCDRRGRPLRHRFPGRGHRRHLRPQQPGHPRRHRRVNWPKAGTLGGHTAMEGQLADIIADRFPSIEKLRFCNSGSEAVTFAVQTARIVHRAPGRDRASQGCYHGGFLTFTAQTNPLNAPFETVIAPFNDIDATRALIDANADRLAVVIIEPMIGGGGCIPADRDFLADAARADGSITASC